VVSTDCPGGSAEILENGKYGRLVPVQHIRELADAIRLTLDSSPDQEQLKARAALFSTDNATRQYLDLMDNIASHTKPEIAFTADANRNAESS
jgi:glycosyltransferase involved in cell wall biosynthesis